MNEELLKSKLLGSLIGTGVGDGLGASLEGWHLVGEEEVRALADRRKVLTQIMRERHFGL